MPLYDYICECNSDKTEILVPYPERDEQVCAKCGAKLTRLVALPGAAIWKTDCPTWSGQREKANG